MFEESRKVVRGTSRPDPGSQYVHTRTQASELEANMSMQHEQAIRGEITRRPSNLTVYHSPPRLRLESQSDSLGK